MRMSELHYYKIDVVQATNLKTVLLFSRDKKKVKISDTDFIRQINKVICACNLKCISVGKITINLILKVTRKKIYFNKFIPYE